MRRMRAAWLAGVVMVAMATTGWAEKPATSRGADALQEALYDPVGRRDPFRPPRASQTTAAGEIRSPLQRYDLGQLKLVAVIYQATEPRAVVEDDAGLGYIVRVGTPIGANGGAVKAIERGKVRVEEESIDFYGERQTSEVVMELATEERGNR